MTMHPHKNAAPLGGPSSGMAQISPRKTPNHSQSPPRSKTGLTPWVGPRRGEFSRPDGEVVHLGAAPRPIDKCFRLSPHPRSDRTSLTAPHACFTITGPFPQSPNRVPTPSAPPIPADAFPYIPSPHSRFFSTISPSNLNKNLILHFFRELTDKVENCMPKQR
jgi:hypothetical protein